MTCNKPQYVERRLKNESTYKHIQDAGFVFFYLFSDPDAGAEIRVSYDEPSGRYSMYVPLEETYENIIHKVLTAYIFLNQFPIKGILKLDDDVIINEPDILNDVYFKADYMGADYLSTDIIDSYNNKISINYFAGPFYWLSNSSLEHISCSIPEVSAEDIHVGIVLYKWKECIIANPRLYNSKVVWWP